jgi:hypothetical protein
MTSPFIDYEEMPEYGYDWSVAPVQPFDPEYRQTYCAEQKRWLEHWMPKVQH